MKTNIFYFLVAFNTGAFAQSKINCAIWPTPKYKAIMVQLEKELQKQIVEIGINPQELPGMEREPAQPNPKKGKKTERNKNLIE